MTGNKPQVEVLAPASGLETIKAAIYAGADAVYTGGSMFGARAYADNLMEEQLLEAIDFVHLHGKRLYLTVNTLLKEWELEKELIRYLTPFYLQGLDAVIVQDLGVFRKIREQFPDLAVHISTQAVVTGAASAKLYEQLGARRIVTARELSLEEIRKIRQETNLEIESFVHGALCYCYSGQCLFSSFIGGRSGNRGRCAQPCRLPYELKAQNQEISNRKKDTYLLSPKDICTLDILPDIIEAGVHSLKIEGRMKRTEYAAGVSELYRKYVDLYLESGRSRYVVEQEDRERLMDLYNRGSFHTGYYTMHNGKEMMSMERPNHNGLKAGTLRLGKKGYQMKSMLDLHRLDVLEFRGITDKKTGKPLELVAGEDVKKENIYFLPEKYTFLLGKQTSVDVYRTKNAALLEELHENYVEKPVQIPVRGRVTITEGHPASLELISGSRNVYVTGELVETAQNRPVDEAYVRKQLNKTGGALFAWEQLDVCIEGNGFLNVKALNQLRRDGFAALEQELVLAYRRKDPDAYVAHLGSEPEYKLGQEEANRIPCYVRVEKEEQFDVALTYPQIEGIDVSIHALDYVGKQSAAVRQFQCMAKECHDNGKKIFLELPYLLRENVKADIFPVLIDIVQHVDGVIAKNMENFAWVKSLPECSGLPVRLDYMAYAMNSEAIRQWKQLGADSITLPVELNRSELMALSGTCELPFELVIYGHMPMMISAQCVIKNTSGCQRRSRITRLQDRKNQLHYVKNYCDSCYNVIYNSEPFSLLDLKDETEELKPSVYKLHFTVETQDEMKNVLDLYVDHFYHHGRGNLEKYTRGHWKRGVE